MRYAIDLLVFCGIFLMAFRVFQNGTAAAAAAIIIAGAADALIWDPKKR